MNIVYTQSSLVTAKTCGCREKREVTYAFSAEPHSLCLNKKDVVDAQINACNELLKHTRDASEKLTIEKEITDLKTALDLID